MPCDAVATATAQVDQRFITELLTQGEGRASLIHWLKTQYGDAAILLSGPGGMSLRVGWPKQYSVDIWGRTITVLETWADQDQQDVEAVRDKIAAFVRDLGGLLLQQKIAASLKGRYNVTESVTAPNKALVLKVKL